MSESRVEFEAGHEETSWQVQVMGPWPRRVTAVLTLGLAAALCVLTLDLMAQPRDMVAQLALDHLHDTGVVNPVTAVLLNYRAFDTWLELVILWIAIAGAWTLLRQDSLRQAERIALSEWGSVLDRMTAIFVPVMILMAGYLLWLGSHAPGGAFQAGAVLASAGVLATLAGRQPLGATSGLLVRIMLCAAVVMFLVVALDQWRRHGSLLMFDPGSAGRWIFALELVATGCIALTLWALYLAAQSSRHAPRTGRRSST